MKKLRNFNDLISDYFKDKFHIKIDPDHVWVDSKQHFDVFPVECLKEKHPLLLSYHKGGLVLVIPAVDYGKLAMGDISIGKYIKEANWGIGYLMEKCKDEFYKSINWRVFKTVDSKSILVRDPEYVKRSFKRLECVYKAKFYDFVTPNESCEECPLEICSLRDRPKLFSFENDIENRDPLIIFVERLKERIKEEFGVEVGKIRTYARKHIWVAPLEKENTVKLVISRKILVELMESNNPEFIKKLADNVEIKVKSPSEMFYNNGDNVIMLQKGKYIPKNNIMGFFDVYWDKVKIDMSFLEAGLTEL